MIPELKHLRICMLAWYYGPPFNRYLSFLPKVSFKMMSWSSNRSTACLLTSGWGQLFTRFKYVLVYDIRDKGHLTRRLIDMKRLSEPAECEALKVGAIGAIQYFAVSSTWQLQTIAEGGAAFQFGTKKQVKLCSPRQQWQTCFWHNNKAWARKQKLRPP